MFRSLTLWFCVCVRLRVMQRAEIALSNRKELERQIVERRAKAEAAKDAEKEMKVVFKEKELAAQRELEEQRIAEARRKNAYRSVLDRQREYVVLCVPLPLVTSWRPWVRFSRSKAQTAAREILRQKEKTMLELDVIAEDPDVLAEVHAKLEALKTKASGRR